MSSNNVIKLMVLQPMTPEGRGETGAPPPARGAL